MEHGWVRWFTVVLLAAGMFSCARKNQDAPTGAAVLETRVTAADLPADTVVSLQLRRPNGAVAAQTQTRVGASFVFKDLAPGTYALVADASGLGAAAVSLVLGPGERLHTVLRLQEPARVEGLVLDRRSQPVASALVLVWRSGDEAGQARETSTDEMGRFVVAKLAAATVTVLVQAPGIGSVKWEAVPLPSRPLRVVLEGEGRSLRGELVGVRGSGSEFRVRLGGAAVRQLRSATPDAQGRFVFHGLGPGEYCLRAGGVSQASAAQTVAIDQIDVMGVRLPLEPGEVITGRVVNGKNQALAAANVMVHAVPPDDCAETVPTDVVGYFSTVALRRGKYQIHADLPGFVGPPAQTITINAKPAPLTVQLYRAARVLGRVLLPNGSPAQGADVVLLTTAQSRFPRDRVPVVAGNLPLAAEAAALGTQALPHLMGMRGASTNALGVFSLGALRPGSFGLRITHAQTGVLQAPPRALVEGEELNFGDLTLPEDKTGAAPPAQAPTITQALPQGDRKVTGMLRDPRGRPLADVALTVRPYDPQAVPVTSATTTSGGAFTLKGLPQARLLLRAQHPQYGVLTHELTPSDKTVNLKYPLPGGIEGEVVNASGRFVSGAQVTLVGPEGLPGPPVQMAGAGFRALGVPPGEWTIQVSLPGHVAEPTVVQVTSGESAREPTVKGIKVKVQSNK